MADPARLPDGTPMASFEGTTLRGTYALEELVGEGAFAGVFRSEQRFFGVPVRRVAVKLTKHTGLVPAEAREVFADVFMLAQAMDEMTDARARSHLVHVYDAGIAPGDGRGFLVMELVQGTTLHDQLASFRRVPAQQLVTWVSQMCRALRSLHTLPTALVHRDLKPSNVLLGTDLAVRLVDFGLAARLLEHGYVPGVAGTLAYMAPETSQGWSTPASDVYSVGLILYEGLTGQLPFAHLVPPLDVPVSRHGDWLFDQRRDVRAVPPSERSNTTTPQLDAVVMRCLEFDPARRYRHAGELLDALETLDAPAPEDPVAVSRRRRGEGDLAGARAALEASLAGNRSSVPVRFALLRELGGVLVELGQPGAGADRLRQAWDLAGGTAVLRSRAERADLLASIADAYGADGNAWQADRYRRMARDERQRR